MKTTLIIPDVQHPLEDKVMLKKVIKVAREIQPDHILQGGDLIDLPQVSRWSQGTALQYAQTLQEHIDGLVTSFFEPLRDACPDAKFTWLEGNHDARLEDFIQKYAPALAPLRALELKSLLRLDEFSVEYVRGPHRIATNTYAVHGHEAGGYCSSQSAWDVKFQKRYGSDKSFVFFHTHQPFLITRAFGYDGRVSPRFTMNVGSIMDPVKATYVKDGAVSWTMSFAIIRDDGKRVYPELITAVDRGFYWNGRKY